MAFLNLWCEQNEMNVHCGTRCFRILLRIVLHNRRRVQRLQPAHMENTDYGNDASQFGMPAWQQISKFVYTINTQILTLKRMFKGRIQRLAEQTVSWQTTAASLHRARKYNVTALCMKRKKRKKKKEKEKRTH